MTTLKLSPNASGAGSFTIAAPSTSSDFTLNLPSTLGTNNGSALVSTDASGNLGLGVTPSAWGSAWRATQIGTTGFIAGRTDAERFYAGSNGYYNGTNWIYTTTGRATYYASNVGQHEWYTAPSGTAGNAISFTQAMTLDASGNLGVATSTPDQKLHVYGNSGATTIAVGDNTITQPYVYLRADATNSYGSLLTRSNHALVFGTNNSERARIDSSGNLLVGTTSALAGSRLYVKGSGNTGSTYTMCVNNSDGTLCFAVEGGGGIYTGTAGDSPYNGTTGSAANVFVSSNGRLQRSTSSLKYKTNVQDATHGLSDLLKLRAVTYEGKAESDAGKTFGGLIAEEVHDAGLTEFVQYAEDGTPDALAYGNMVSLCIKAIQEQQTLIQDQLAIINAQSAELEQLKAQLTSVSEDVASLKGAK